MVARTPVLGRVAAEGQLVTRLRVSSGARSRVPAMRGVSGSSGRPAPSPAGSAEGLREQSLAPSIRAALCAAWPVTVPPAAAPAPCHLPALLRGSPLCPDRPGVAAGVRGPPAHPPARVLISRFRVTPLWGESSRHGRTCRGTRPSGQSAPGDPPFKKRGFLSLSPFSAVSPAKASGCPGEHSQQARRARGSPPYVGVWPGPVRALGAAGCSPWRSRGRAGQGCPEGQRHGRPRVCGCRGQTRGRQPAPLTAHGPGEGEPRSSEQEGARAAKPQQHGALGPRRPPRGVPTLPQGSQWLSMGRPLEGMPSCPGRRPLSCPRVPAGRPGHVAVTLSGDSRWLPQQKSPQTFAAG